MALLGYLLGTQVLPLITCLISFAWAKTPGKKIWAPFLIGIIITLLALYGSIAKDQLNYGTISGMTALQFGLSAALFLIFGLLTAARQKKFQS